MPHDFQSDIDAIGDIAAVPTILDVICRTTGMGFAAVARVTDDRWIACSVVDNIDFGLRPGGELKLETTICNEIRANREAVVIDHVALDEAFVGHHTPAMYGFQSYISMPIIRRDGTFFGTLCAIDPKPAKLNNPEVIGMFKLFAELIATHLDSSERVAAAEATAKVERNLRDLREQFIAVLGHDLRNPLGSIVSGLRILQRSPDEAKRAQVMTMMEASAFRMGGLIDNVMDFARTRMGAGLKVPPVEPQSLQPVLEQVIAEFKAVQPHRRIETELSADVPVVADRQRLARLFSNLIGNALVHGDAGKPIRVTASTSEGEFVLSVANEGAAISAEAMDTLFQPFVRGNSENPTGLGLGLYIAKEIARMHGGKLDVASTPDETRFTFSMPTGV